MQTIWDPLRKKEVALTPEENVRQWFIGVLRDGMKVPLHMMSSEVSFKFGQKDFRADILVYDRQAKPLMVVECKRPDVTINQAVVDQALRYNMALDLKYIVVTNGLKTFIFKRDENGFSLASKAPVYDEMVEEKDVK